MKHRRIDIVNHIANRISSLYSAEECKIIARTVAAHLSGDNPIKFITDPNEEIEINGLENVIEELAAARPLQYVLNRVDFFGLELYINQGVLIPRPETEELVMWAIDSAKKIESLRKHTTIRILDLCTGSGCIALALKSALPHTEVTAVDISDDALKIARKNVEMLNLNVEIVKDDVLGGVESLRDRQFDIIISNPPYIPQQEITTMHRNVVEHEPHIALFVDDNDPLCFYRAIAQSAQQMLKKGGYLLFEIHEKLHTQTCELLVREGYHDIELRHDFRDKPRMICCRKRII